MGFSRVWDLVELVNSFINSIARDLDLYIVEVFSFLWIFTN